MIAVQAALGSAMNLAGAIVLVVAGSVAAPAISQVINPSAPPSITAPTAPHVPGVGVLGMADQMLLAGYVYRGCVSSGGNSPARYMMRSPAGETIFLSEAQIRRSTARETFVCRKGLIG